MFISVFYKLIRPLGSKQIAAETEQVFRGKCEIVFLLGFLLCMRLTQYSERLQARGMQSLYSDVF